MTQILKLDRLLKNDQKLFHTQDLALLWGIDNRNSLYTAIKRLVKKGVLITIRKGLYSVLPIDQIDEYRLGAALIHRFCYVSCETVLAESGVISQKVYPITFVSSSSSKINIKDKIFVYRMLKSEYLLNPEGIIETDGVFKADKERALADMLYFNPNYYLDNSLSIDWKRVSEIQRKVGYKK